MCIYLPRDVGRADDGEAEIEAIEVDRGEGETVLIVDDEPSLRMLITDTLLENAYRPLEAIDGASALRILDSDARIDLLVRHVGLPGGMNGRQVAELARKRRPGLKVLFITEYAENAVMGATSLEPGMAVLSKPFAVTGLAVRIRKLIEKRT